MRVGKQICEILKSIRKEIADKYGLIYKPIECIHKGECNGTCPHCDAELKDLQNQLKAKGKSRIEIDKNFKHRVQRFKQRQIHKLEKRFLLEGEPLLDNNNDSTDEDSKILE